MANENEAKLEAARRWFKEAQYGLMVHWGSTPFSAASGAGA